eukprot:3592653-Rhodomonas_salina.1
MTCRLGMSKAGKRTWTSDDTARWENPFWKTDVSVMCCRARSILCCSIQRGSEERDDAESVIVCVCGRKEGSTRGLEPCRGQSSAPKDRSTPCRKAIGTNGTVASPATVTPEAIKRSLMIASGPNTESQSSNTTRP